MSTLFGTVDPKQVKKRARIKLCADLARRDFKIFVRQFWEEVPGAGRLKWNWHIEKLCDELQKIAEDVHKKYMDCLPREYDLAVNLPPGTSKSSVFSILFPAWLWTWFPEARILSASHTDSLAMDLATKARSVIQSDKYLEWYPHIILSEVQNAKGHYRNTLGGERFICTVAGKSPTGKHAHFLLVDDPIDPKKVLSELELLTAKEFMTNVLPNRKVDKASAVTILVMQRLGLGDPTEVMLEEAKKEGAAPVRHICLPSDLDKADDGTWIVADVSPMEWAHRYINGQLDPTRLGDFVLKENKARGALFFATQFRQRPYAREGGMFKEVWFYKREPWPKAAPFNARRIRYWDRAASVNSGCATCGVLMADDGEDFYIEHVEHGHWGPDERNAIMVATAKKDRLRYGPKHEPLIVVEKETGSTGEESFRNLARKLAGFRIQDDLPSGSKDVRAGPWADQLAAGTVVIVEDGTWDILAYIKEHVAFNPDVTQKRLGKLVDRVDASSGAFNMLLAMRREGIKGVSRIYSSGKRKEGLRVIALSKEQLQNSVIDDKALLISISDLAPLGTDERPIHGCNHLLDYLSLRFCDMAPVELQERWQEPVPPWNLPPSELIMTRDHGKKLWGFITKKRPEQYEAIVITDNGDRRARSVAQGIADALRVEKGLLETDKGDVNDHIVNTVKSTRNMVL